MIQPTNEGARRTIWVCGRCDSRDWFSGMFLCENCGVDMRDTSPYPVEQVVVHVKRRWWQFDELRWEEVTK